MLFLTNYSNFLLISSMFFWLCGWQCWSVCPSTWSRLKYLMNAMIICKDIFVLGCPSPPSCWLFIIREKPSTSWKSWWTILSTGSTSYFAADMQKCSPVLSLYITLQHCYKCSRAHPACECSWMWNGLELSTRETSETLLLKVNSTNFTHQSAFIGVGENYGIREKVM